jgi:hypothetical protein
MGTAYSNIETNNFLLRNRFYLLQMWRLQPQISALWPCYNCPLTHSCIIYIPTHNLQACFRYNSHYVCTDRFVIYGYQTLSSTNWSLCYVVVLCYTKTIPLTTVHIIQTPQVTILMKPLSILLCNLACCFIVTNCWRLKCRRLGWSEWHNVLTNFVKIGQVIASLWGRWTGELGDQTRLLSNITKESRVKSRRLQATVSLAHGTSSQRWVEYGDRNFTVIIMFIKESKYFGTVSPLSQHFQ